MLTSFSNDNRADFRCHKFLLKESMKHLFSLQTLLSCIACVELLFNKQFTMSNLRSKRTQ